MLAFSKDIPFEKANIQWITIYLFTALQLQLQLHVDCVWIRESGSD
jgi:hypothetical protein